MPDPSPAAERHILFTLSGRLFALPASAVRRILPVPKLDRLPAAPRMVAGVFRYRGELVPVLRLDLLLGLPKPVPDLYRALILTERAGKPVTLVVDRVLDLTAATPSPLGPDEALSFNRCAVGGLAHGGETVVVLAPERLLTAVEDGLLDGFRTAAQERLALWEAPR